MKEIWKKIRNYENYYVSNFGNVKNSKDRILKSKLNKWNYLQVVLYKNGKSKTLYVHRIVAEIFIKKIKNKTQVNHKDGNKLNNNVENLEWCTAKENINHAIKNKLKKCDGQENPNAKKVRQFDMNDNFINEYSTLKEAGEKTNTNKTCISQVCHEKRKMAGGYKWRYADDTNK